MPVSHSQSKKALEMSYLIKSDGNILSRYIPCTCTVRCAFQTNSPVLRTLCFLFASEPFASVRLPNKQKAAAYATANFLFGAGDGNRTRESQLGKLVLYH